MFFKSIIPFFSKLFFISKKNDRTPHFLPKTDLIYKLNKPEHNKSQSIQKKENKPRPSSPKKTYDINKLNFQIKKNIFYLTELINKLSHFSEYDSYSAMLNDLKKQSEGCLKILYRLKPEKIGFESTVKMIIRHTNEVSRLMDEN